MGLLYWQAKMLLDARRAGVRMDRLLVIGRQSLFLYSSELRKIRKTCPGALNNYKWAEYSDRFFKECLEVDDVSTLDYSPYEGADVLHDLNQPIGDELKGRFDVVIEAGTLEHIFNFPMAVTNLMKMTRVGGTISISTVANNMCGHGFYQFSPELIFRVFAPENGFQLGEVFAVEARYPGIELARMSDAFTVPNPASIGGRVGLVTRRPVMLFFHACKISDVLPFAKPTMQSDYVAAWVSNAKASAPRMPQWIRGLPFYGSFRNWVKGQGQLREFSLKNKRVFRKLRASHLA